MARRSVLTWKTSHLEEPHGATLLWMVPHQQTEDSGLCGPANLQGAMRGRGEGQMVYLG